MVDGSFVEEFTRAISAPGVLLRPDDTALLDPALISLPPGWRATLFDPESVQAAPRRAAGMASLATVDALAKYVGQVARRAPRPLAAVGDTGEQTAPAAYDALAFLNVAEEAVDLTVILNPSAADNPGWNDFRARVRLFNTVPWLQWIGQAGSWHDQPTFAAFLEERLDTIAHPDGADVLEAVRNFRLLTDVTFEKAIETSNDRISFTYREEDRPGSVVVPSKLRLVVRPFRDCGYVADLTARLRWKRPNASQPLSFRWELDADAVAEALAEAADEIATAFETETGIPTMFGEAPPAARTRPLWPDG